MNEPKEPNIQEESIDAHTEPTTKLTSSQAHEQSQRNIEAALDFMGWEDLKSDIKTEIAQAKSTTILDKHHRTLDIFPFKCETIAARHHIPPPVDAYKVFPKRVRNPIKQDRRKATYWSIPNAGGTPTIRLGESTDWPTIEKMNHHGHAAKCTTRTTAVLHILQTYLNEVIPPSTLCLNCYTHHRQLTSCTDTHRDFQSLIDASTAISESDPRHFYYNPCAKCGLPHPPQHEPCALRSKTGLQTTSCVSDNE